MMLSRSRSVLLVVDVQDRLAPAIHDGGAVLGRIETLLRAAGRLGVPVAATEQYPRGLGRTVAGISALLDPGAIVEKIHFSAAEEPGFVERLRGHDRRQVVVAGMEAHVCVLQTALGLATAGFDPFVVADAVGSRTAADKALGLERLRGEGVRIVSTEMVVFEWLHRAGTPEFKDVVNLIK